MGDIVRKVFGGSKSTSSSNSENQAYGTLLGALNGNIGQGNSAMSTLGSILGIGDPASGKAAVKNFMDSTGYNFILDSGMDAITSNRAANGLFRSGETGKRMQQFGQDLGATKLNELMQNLTSLGQYGLGSANTIASAGGKSESQSKSTNDGGIFNSLFPGGLSDERLKNLLRKVGNLSNGLVVYEFEYTAYPGRRFIGVVAQDVERIQPEALGPKRDGYLTVNYSKLEKRDDLPSFGAIEEEVA